MNKRVYGVGVAALVAATSFAAGWFGGVRHAASQAGVLDGTMPHRILGQYKFISPLIACDISENRAYQPYAALQKKYESIAADAKSAHTVSDISIYFRDLNSARWIGLNENEQYWPASLMKVPTLIASLRAAEDRPGLLMDKITFLDAKDENAAQYFKPTQAIQNGKSYSFEDLLNTMIRFSDNNATVALAKVIGTAQIEDVFKDGRIVIPQDSQEPVDYMTPVSYAYFFRLLYNASYLNRSSSEFALQLLASADFDRGLRAGVPASVAVAHKFGEQVMSSGTKELHDCGIVYFPEKPYLLCVMTKSAALFENAADVIKQVSEETYQEVNAGHV